MPYIAADMGMERTNVGYITLASVDALSNVVSVYLSTSMPFVETDSVLCRANITFSAVGDTISVACPLGARGRYVTITRSHADMVSRRQRLPSH